MTVQEATDALRALLKKHTAFSEKGFDIDIESAADEWNDCLTAIGVRRAYGLMGTYLCEEYRGMYGREFLLGDRCVAYEIVKTLVTYGEVSARDRGTMVEDVFFALAEYGVLMFAAVFAFYLLIAAVIRKIAKKRDKTEKV